jgi:Skp family chaperone for outer membrane proteins
MRFARSIAVAALFAVCLAAATAAAQTVKIAVANPAKIFTSLQETQDLQAKMANDGKTLQATDAEKRQKLKDMQAQRDTLREGTAQYDDLNKQLTQASIDYEVWNRLQTAELQRQKKSHMKSLFEKISASTAEIAKQRGIDLVIAEQHPDFPPNMDDVTVENIQMLIAQRNVLYNSGAMDISNDIIASMDAKYKSGK